MLSLLATLALSVVAFDDPTPENPLGPVPEIVARVNETDLTAADLAKKIRQLVPQVSFHQTIPQGRARELRRDALEGLILDELKWQQAVREKKVITDTEVRAEVDRVIAGLPAREREQWIGRELTLVQQHGAAIRRRLTLAKLEAELVPAEIMVPEERIDAELIAHPELTQLPPQVRLRHLLVKLDPASGQKEYDDGAVKIATLRERIVGGESFGVVARESSDDVFRERGGETGWLTREEIIYAPVARAAFVIEPGTVSQVMESLHGFHLIEVIERRDGQQLENDEARKQVREILRGTIAEEKRVAWDKSLFDGAKIERLYDPMADAKAEAPTSRPRG